MVPYKFDYY